MKIGICVGNPPYQKDNNNTFPQRIWDKFIILANQLASKGSFIHPSGWLSRNSKVKDKFINNGLKSFIYFKNFQDVFDYRVAGSITITNFEKGFKKDIFYNENIKYNKDELFTENKEESELSKKLSLSNFNNKSILTRIIGIDKQLDRSIFGMTKEEYAPLLKENKTGLKKPIRVWASKNFNKKAATYHQYWAEKSDFSNVPSNIFSTRKIMLSRTNGCQFVQLMEKDAICSQYYIIPEKDSDRDLSLIKSLMRTKTITALTNIIQKDSIYTSGIDLIPDYTELAKKLPANVNEFTDQWFYKEFNFSQDLIDYIENNFTIRPDNYGCK